jgi:hypothetical protein
MYCIFFMKSNRKLNLEGSYAYKKDDARKIQNMEREKIPALPPFPPQLQLLSRFLRLPQKNYVFHCNSFYAYKTSQQTYFQKKIISKMDFQNH